MSFNPNSKKANDNFPDWQPQSPQRAGMFSRVPGLLADLDVNQIPQYQNREVPYVMRPRPRIPPAERMMDEATRGVVISPNFAYLSVVQSMTPEQQFAAMMGENNGGG
jgi:hypothetical protein